MASAQDRLNANVSALLDFTNRTQRALALRLHVSQPQISLLLNGQRPWRVRDLDSLADFFAVTVPSLFTEGALDRRNWRERRSGLDRRAPRTYNKTPDVNDTPPEDSALRLRFR